VRLSQTGERIREDVPARWIIASYSQFEPATGFHGWVSMLGDAIRIVPPCTGAPSASTKRAVWAQM